MLTTADEGVLTVRIHEAVVGPELVGDLEAVLGRVDGDEIETLVLRFDGTGEAVAGDFPDWPPGGARPDMRYFARWEETLSRISRLKAKTFAAYDGRVGAAAVQAGLVTDLRLASATARLSPGSLAEGRFPGLGAWLLPKFVGLGQARRIFLLGAELTAGQAADLGLVDLVDDSVEAVVATAVKALRAVTPEAAGFTRRILDDAYQLERGAATELAKAARYQVGRSGRWPTT